MSPIRRTYIDIRDPTIRVLKCLGNLTDCVLYHVGRGITAELKGERYQDCARTEVQSSDVFQVGDAVELD